MITDKVLGIVISVCSFLILWEIKRNKNKKGSK